MSQAISGLCSLYWLNVELSSRLQVDESINYPAISKYIHIYILYTSVNRVCVQRLGLWDLYTDMELSMIPVLAGEV